jgi:AcrR family transcriptional regulator
MKGSKRRAAILASAAPMFNQRGFAGTSIAEILEATSLEKGGLYNHFSSKEELAVASFEYAWQEVNAYFARTLHGIESGAPRLRAYVDAFEEYVKRPVVLGGCPLVNSALEADDALPFLMERVRAAFREMRSFVRHQVQRGVEKGHFRADTDVDAVTDFSIASLDGAIVLARGTGSRASIGRVLGVLRTWMNSI